MKNTTLCYMIQNGQYLLLHRVKKKNDANQDKWIGIGGKFEDKESPEDCMLREFQEETGCRLTDYRYRGIITFVSNSAETEYMHLFTASRYEGTLAECDEGVLEWVSPAQFSSLRFWEGDYIFLDLLQQDIPFFSLKLVYQGERLIQAVLNGSALPLPYSGVFS